MLLPRAICYRDLEDRDSRQYSSFSEIKWEERFYWCRRRTQYSAFTFAHLRMLRQPRLELWSMSARRRSCSLSLSFGRDSTIGRISSPNKFIFHGPLEEPQSPDARSSTVMMPHIGVKSQRCTKNFPTFWVRCSGFASGPTCSMTPAFCAPLIHGGCWHKKVVVPDFWWVVVSANDSESKFAFPLQF